MFEGFSQNTINFMWNIRFNNNKEWFDSHKDDFKQYLQLPMKELGLSVFKQVSDKYCDYGFIHKLSRIYKDARRLRSGEGPYRDNMWFSIEKPSQVWTTTPVFWFEVSPDNWSYGLGYYQAKADTMSKFRARIDRDPKKFQEIIAFLDKQDEFILDGSEYVRRKVAPTDKTASWYNKKSFSIIHKQENGEELYSPELVNRIVNGVLSLMPLYDYLITLYSDPMPTENKYGLGF